MHGGMSHGIIYMATCIPYACLMTWDAYLMHAMMRLGHDAWQNAWNDACHMMTETCIGHTCRVHDDVDDHDND